MKSPRITLLSALILAALTGLAPAQVTLRSLEDAFAKDREALIKSKSGQVSFADIKALAKDHSQRLEQFVANCKDSRDRVNGRLMLTNIYLDVGEREQAKASLDKIAPEEAGAMELLTGAEFAEILGEKQKRDQWVDMAIAKDAPFEERMAAGMFLMTRLVEVEKGENIFTAALGEAVGDEDKSKVLWYRAAAIREREDLEEGAYDVELNKLAEAYPETYYGGIAKNRLEAMDFKPGADAIPFKAKNLRGRDVSLSDFQGEVLLLDFWASWCEPCVEALPYMKELRKKYRDQGLRMLSISLDESRDDLEAAIEEHNVPWAQIFDGKSWQSDLALRYSVEQVPHMLLIDREGKIAGVGLFPWDEPAKKFLVEQVEKALK
ncbi:MAG: TlpA family protein disulfide reductase [Planctomycetota bacterium]|jgi:thiol-disulfide isomerase/thioredoxin